MTIQFSDDVLERMGFKLVSPSRTLVATFHSLSVYKIEGFTLDEPSLEPMSGALAGIPYSFCVGSSVNAVCRRLMQDDDLTDSESKWQAEYKCAPPYLIVHVGSADQHEATVSRLKEEGQTIVTFDCFRTAKAELAEREGKVLPPLLSALACSFSTNEPPIRFLPIVHTVVGKTADGQTLHDIRIVVSATLSTSSKLEPSQIEVRLASGTRIASDMNSKVARFFQLGIDEDDQLKKFLYFFLAIEIETHATFKSIDHAAQLSTLLTAPSRIAISTQGFFGSQRERWTNLRDRFLWCAICVWHSLSDADIDEFKRLKEVRDNIAHGTIATPPPWAVVGAETLAKKLLSA